LLKITFFYFCKYINAHILYKQTNMLDVINYSAMIWFRATRTSREVKTKEIIKQKFMITRL